RREPGLRRDERAAAGDRVLALGVEQPRLDAAVPDREPVALPLGDGEALAGDRLVAPVLRAGRGRTREQRIVDERRGVAGRRGEVDEVRRLRRQRVLARAVAGGDRLLVLLELRIDRDDPSRLVA